MSWPEALDRYLADLVARGRRPHTVRGYRGDLRVLASRLEEASAGDLVLHDWLASLEGFAPATRARRISAARGFLRWAAELGAEVAGLEVLESAAAPHPAAPSAARADERAAPPAARADEWATAEAALKAIPLQADRDQLLFKLLARAGLRPGEALALRIEDFDPSVSRLRVTGWGGAERDVLIDDPELRLRLSHWIRASARTSGPLFCAPGRSSGLRYQSMLERWQRYATASGTRLRLGDLRRGHAARLLAGGVPEWVVRERLGQPTGPLPVPSQRTADDEIRAWRDRLPPAEARPKRSAGDTRRAAG